MKPHRYPSSRLFKSAIITLILGSIILNACGPGPVSLLPTLSQTQTPSQVQNTPSTLAVVSFNVLISNSNNQVKDISIDILDEVTGLGLNPIRYQMKGKDSTHYYIQLPFPPGSVIKYRYFRGGSPSAVEYNTHNEQVRYRLFRVSGSSQIDDIVTTWGDEVYKGSTGRISGIVSDMDSGSGLPNIMISAGGLTTLSNGDGSFLVDGLPPGIHNLVAYALDGSYQTFQQGAKVDVDLDTPAKILLKPAHKVNINFKVSIPKDALGVPVRLAGNLLQLGNTFADLNGGTNTIASRMPVMSLQSDGQYSLTMILPEGVDLRYKYTLGDGFWNSEQTSDGKFALRQLIVPGNDTEINDSVETWRDGKSAPIKFEVTVPPNTPATDIISIQFNPFAWLEPVPMWSLGNNRWLYILFGPMDILGKLSYRYCRNDQCGSADDINTSGNNPSGWPVVVGLLPQTFKDDINRWAWWNPAQTPTTIPASDINPRGNAFFAGIEFQPGYYPSWQPYILPDLQEFSKTGANWVIFSPSWTYSGDTKLPDFRLTPGKNPLWPDLISNITQSRALGLNTAIFPQPVFIESPYQWWQSAAKDNIWWQKWFEQYRQFILYHADLAAKSGASALIVGGEWLIPALPGGLLPDGTPSGTPSDSQSRWQNILKDVRNRYKGQIIWALPNPQSNSNIPGFLDSVDQIYIILSNTTMQKSDYTLQDLGNSINDTFDTSITSVHNQFNKPIIIGLDYPSITNTASLCSNVFGDTCRYDFPLDQPYTETNQLRVNLQAQVDNYNIAFTVINQRDWINGIVSRGFYPPVELQDSSRSIHGKPAYDVVWYWFSRITTP